MIKDKKKKMQNGNINGTNANNGQPKDWTRLLTSFWK